MKPNISSRMVRWLDELGEFDLKFRPRKAIKT